MKNTIAAAVALLALTAAVGHAQQRMAIGSKTSGNSTNSQMAGQKRKGGEQHLKFNFSMGLSLAKSNVVTNNYSDGLGGTATMSRHASGFGIFIYLKYHFISKEKFSLSVGVPLTLALSSSGNSQTDVHSLIPSFLYDLPLMIDYNGGAMTPASHYGKGRFGYFAGLGIGIENTIASYSYESYGYTGTVENYTKAKSIGPNLHAGAVVRIGNETHQLFIGLRLSYKIGLNSDKFNYFTPSVFLNF